MFVVATVFGILGLVWGADKFIDGALQLSRALKISPLVVGLTVVSFGTSLPELITTVIANLTGHPDVAVGNVIGSNIANVCLILGTAALFRPLLVSQTTMKREYLFLVVISLLFWFMSYNDRLSRTEGAVLFLTLIGYLIWMVKHPSNSEVAAILLKEADQLSTSEAGTDRESNLKLAFNLVAGLLVLTLASRSLVWGGVGIARWINVPELIIGLSLVALGTSLPELAASIAGAIKKSDDIAVGNVVGSNIFNILGIIGISSLVNPLQVSQTAVSRDFPIMLFTTLLLWPLARPKGPEAGRISRPEAMILLGGYFAYILFMFLKR